MLRMVWTVMNGSIGVLDAGWHNRGRKGVRRPSHLAALRAIGRGARLFPAPAVFLFVALLGGLTLVGCDDSGKESAHKAVQEIEPRAVSGCGARPAVPAGGVGRD